MPTVAATTAAAGNAYYQGGHYWGGGYWHGGYWPHVLPAGLGVVLPGAADRLCHLLVGRLPYYYWNNLYYTWNPGYNGYVVTDPPPAAGGDEAGAPMGDDPSGGTAAPRRRAAAQGLAGGAGADLYVYPRNGQSEQQTSTDRYECHSWAVNQTGFDPTRGAQPVAMRPDYRRAMIACLDARGYSAR